MEERKVESKEICGTVEQFLRGAAKLREPSISKSSSRNLNKSQSQRTIFGRYQNASQSGVSSKRKSLKE